MASKRGVVKVTPQPIENWLIESQLDEDRSIEPHLVEVFVFQWSLKSAQQQFLVDCHSPNWNKIVSND